MSPVGASLLGQTVGSVARWSTPAGDERAAEVVAILFQPEASGDYVDVAAACSLQALHVTSPALPRTSARVRPALQPTHALVAAPVEQP